MYRCRCVRAAATSENKENKIQKQPNNNRETYVIAITQWIFTWCSCCRLLVWSFFSSSFTDSVSWNKNNPLTTQNLSYLDSKSRFILTLFYSICKNLLQNQLKTSNKIELQQPKENVNSEQFQCGNEKKQQEKEKITQNKLKSKQRRNRKKWWKRLSRRAAASQCKGSSNGTKTKKNFNSCLIIYVFAIVLIGSQSMQVLELGKNKTIRIPIENKNCTKNVIKATQLCT